MRAEYRPPTVDRRFMAILGLSLCLHGSVFVLQLKARKQLPELPPIVATLRAASLAVIAESPRMPQPEAAPAVSPKVRQPSARPAVAPPRERTTAAAPARAPVAAAAPVANTVPATQVAAEPADAAPAVATTAPVPPQGDLLADYRRRLGELFSRHQVYPRIAAMRGWEGEVQIRLKVARKGSLLLVQLEHSSGFEVLDRHALAMVGDLPGLPALPDGLVGDELQLIVPISYKLSKTT